MAQSHKILCALGLKLKNFVSLLSFFLFFGIVILFPIEHQRQPASLESSLDKKKDYRKLARTLLDVNKGRTPEFEISHGLTLMMYVFQALGEFGDYTLEKGEVIKLITLTENLIRMELPVDVKTFVDQIKSVTFTNYSDHMMVSFQSLDSKGIVINIDQESETSSVEKIVSLSFPQQFSLKIWSLKSEQDWKELKKFVQKPPKIPLLPKSWFKAFQIIHEEVAPQLPVYLNQRQQKGPAPLRIEWSAGELLVITDTILKDVSFELLRSYHLPGFGGEKALPSSMVEMAAKLFKIRLTLDQ